MFFLINESQWIPKKGMDNFVFNIKSQSYRFETTWGWVYDDWIVIVAYSKKKRADGLLHKCYDDDSKPPNTINTFKSMFKSQKTVFYKLSNLTKENGPHMLTGSINLNSMYTHLNLHCTVKSIV